MKWPWTSRARLDDALRTIEELKAKAAQQETEIRRLTNRLFYGYGIQPIYAEAEPVKPVMAAPKPPAPQVDGMQEPAPTVIREAVKHGARSAREICQGVERILDTRYRILSGIAREPHSSVPVVPEKQAVAEELSRVLVETGGNGNGNH